MAKETSKKVWQILALVIFVSLYAIWLNWSEDVDRRLKILESKVDARPLIAREASGTKEERQVAPDTPSDRYLCSSDKTTYFTYKSDQKNCRVVQFLGGWKNLYFSKELIFDYYNDGMSHTGSEVKVWSRMLLNSPKINVTQQFDGGQNKIEFDEQRRLFVFNCTARDYKNPNVIYFLKNEELLRTTGDRTIISSNGLKSGSYDDIIEQIVPGTFVETLYKEVCH